MMKTFDPAKPVQTRDGRKARIICAEVAGSSYPIVGLVAREDGREDVEEFAANGQYVNGSSAANPNDLVNIPERHERFFSLGHAYGNPEGARSAHGGRWSVLKVVTEGYNGPVISSEIVPA